MYNLSIHYYIVKYICLRLFTRDFRHVMIIIIYDDQNNILLLLLLCVLFMKLCPNVFQY